MYIWQVLHLSGQNYFVIEEDPPNHKIDRDRCPYSCLFRSIQQ